MDKMDKILFKTKLAGLLGVSTSGGSFVSSEYVEGWLRVILLLLGCISAAVSIVYIVKINGHRNRIKLIEEALAERRLCEDCIKGKLKQEPCPIADAHRPATCPYAVKISLLAKLKKLTDDLISEETTTK
jgi:hypothetical protein